MDLEITRRARALYEVVLAYRPPSATSVDDTQDSSTPIAHLLVMNTIFRLVVLLELTRVFPELITHGQSMREVSQSQLDLAIAVLTMVADLPESSGANLMLTIPLLSAGSALQDIESVPKDIHHSYDLNATSFDVLCG
ncbi:uncharacterized protein yc1106_08560 [Curvularia clavata]|uniref:Uncharacterized protein n=1 Tax=Curvularia clavata TaxID=95742 RepID=A0A9Q8ZFR2_CURCL|nr:uncharacterized protein yc1106_08560 [Curvularia clavata]